MSGNEESKKIGQIVAKAWQDANFKSQLMASPVATLKAEGVEVPAGLEVRVVENTDNVFHLVLPPKPAGEELSDDELAAVAGGKAPRFCTCDPRDWGF